MPKIAYKLAFCMLIIIGFGKNAFEIHTGVNFTTQGVNDAFEISEGITVPAGSYDHAESQIVLITNPSKPVSL